MATGTMRDVAEARVDGERPKRGPAPSAPPTLAASVLRLQATAGNTAVARAIADATLLRQPAGEGAGATTATAAPPQPGGGAPETPVADDGRVRADVYQAVREAIAEVRRANEAAAAAAAPRRRRRRRATPEQRRARQTLQQAVLTLAGSLRTNLPPRTILDRYLDRRDIAADEKVRVVGRLVAETARMEFLLGRLYHLGAARGWESGGANRGVFPETYERAMGVGAEPWCTMFAGYAYTRLGFRAGPESEDTSIFRSGYRLRQFSTTGRNLAGAQLADEANPLGTGGALVDRAAWRELTRSLRAARSPEDRQAATEAWLDTHPHPQPGDIVVKARGSDVGNTFSPGAKSHTMIVDRFEGHTISTVEGNRADAIGAREIDLTDPAQTGGIIYLTRMGAEHFGVDDTAPPDPDADVGGGVFAPLRAAMYSEDTLVGAMTDVNARLVEIAAAEGWIASDDPDAAVSEWQGDAGSAGSEA